MLILLQIIFFRNAALHLQSWWNLSACMLQIFGKKIEMKYQCRYWILREMRQPILQQCSSNSSTNISQVSIFLVPKNSEILIKSTLKYQQYFASWVTKNLPLLSINVYLESLTCFCILHTNCMSKRSKQQTVFKLIFGEPMNKYHLSG